LPKDSDSASGHFRSRYSKWVVIAKE
jgi:hypothetical protein